MEFTVRDTGSGIPREQLSRIFDRFYSTKKGPDESGTGAGLSACKDIVDAHQGRLRVESTVGKGTAFTVRLPVFQETESAASAVPLPELDVPTRNRQAGE